MGYAIAAAETVALRLTGASAPRTTSRPTPLARVFEEGGTLLRLTRHQQLAISTSEEQCAYFVRSGDLALEAEMPARHILGFWHGHDLLETSQLPALPKLALRALGGVELWRLRYRLPKNPFNAQSDIAAAHSEACALLIKRLLVAHTVLGRLNGEERLAAFLIDAVSRIGQVVGNRATLRLPMSRADIADHLSLNPDTLSRIMTSLKATGVIESQGRSCLVVRDWKGLQARTPLAGAVIDT